MAKKTCKLNPELAPAEPIEITRVKIVDVSPVQRWAASVAEKALEPSSVITYVKVFTELWWH